MATVYSIDVAGNKRCTVQVRPLPYLLTALELAIGCFNAEPLHIGLNNADGPTQTTIWSGNEQYAVMYMHKSTPKADNGESVVGHWFEVRINNTKYFPQVRRRKHISLTLWRIRCGTMFMLSSASYQNLRSLRRLQYYVTTAVMQELQREQRGLW